MNALIQITTNEQGSQVVSARELYEFLEVSERFSKWFERMAGYGFSEGSDYTPYQMVHPSNNQTATDYALTLDTAKHIAMIQRSEKGMQARQYFIDYEKQGRSLLPATYLDALKALVASEEQKAQLTERTRQAESTVAILTHVNKTYTATEVAKELGFKSANQLNTILHERRIQYKQNGTWVLYSDYANLGYVEIKQEVLDNGHVIFHRRWTQLGREFLLKLLTLQTA